MIPVQELERFPAEIKEKVSKEIARITQAELEKARAEIDRQVIQVIQDTIIYLINN